MTYWKSNAGVLTLNDGTPAVPGAPPVGNTAGPDYWTGVQAYSNGTVTYATATKTWELLVTSGTTSWAQFRRTISSGLISIEAEILGRAAPSAETRLFQINDNTDLNYACRVNMLTTNRLRLYNSANATLWTSTNAMPTNAGWRIALCVQKGTTTSNGNIAVYLYTAGDGKSTTLLESYTPGATVNAGTTDLSSVWLGFTSGGPWQLSLRNVQMQDATFGPIGPAGTDTLVTAEKAVVTEVAAKSPSLSTSIVVTGGGPAPIVVSAPTPVVLAAPTLAPPAGTVTVAAPAPVVSAASSAVPATVAPIDVAAPSPVVIGITQVDAPDATTLVEAIAPRVLTNLPIVPPIARVTLVVAPPPQVTGTQVEQTTMTWLVNGINLTRWCWLKTSLWRPPASVRRVTVTPPRRHGTIAAGSVVFDEPQLTFEMIIRRNSQQELEEATNDLLGLLSSPSITITRVSANITSSAPARLVSISPGDYQTGAYAKFTAVYAIPTVFFREPNYDSETITLTTNMVNREIISLRGSTAPINDAIIRVRGPLSWFKITDTASSTGVEWAGSPLVATEYLFIDLENLTARKSISPFVWDAGGTDVTGGIDYPAQGPLQLWATMQSGDPSTRVVLVNVTGAGFDATTAMTIRGGRAYL